MWPLPGHDLHRVTLHVWLCVAILLLPNASLIANATNITTAAQTGSDFRCLGTSSECGQTFGQVFTVSTSDTYLSSFSLFPTLVAGSALTVQMSIYAWSGNNKMGSALFQSGAYAMANGSSGVLNYTPNLLLTQGTQYIAFLNTAGLGNSTNAQSGFTSVSNTYAGGNFVWERTAEDGNWNDTFSDTRFTAVFTQAPAAVPEPASLGLLGLGAAGMILARRRKQRAVHA
jgi:hypothetical protein